MQNLRLIRKIHEGMDNTCYAAILTNWDLIEMQELELAEKAFDIVSRGASEEDVAKQLEVDLTHIRKLLKEYKMKYCVDEKSFLMFDKLYSKELFFDVCREMTQRGQKDAYFSLNSFYRQNRVNNDVRHINAFVLDFDYYKVDEYRELSAVEFYKKIENKLSMTPTAVMDSGRGLYIIYAFKHCSYHMDKLYHAIIKHFYALFEKYGMDLNATLTTQVIRIPGTINSKNGRKVEILEFNDTNYKLQDFAALLPWSEKEVKAYKKEKLHHKKEKKTKQIDLSKRKPHFKDYYEDFRTLIHLRNQSKVYEGYRELLLYLIREKACWMGYTVDESIALAKELNDLLRVPLNDIEIERNCKPSGNRACSSIDTIIDKLKINIDEQKKMKVLKRRWLKKSLYAKRKRKHVLLNRSPKQQELFERRTRICELKNVHHLRNSRIAEILGISKSQVTRDLQYIKAHGYEFIQKLKDYMGRIEDAKETDNFRRKLVFERQKQLLEWLKIARRALDYLVREIGVAKN